MSTTALARSTDLPTAHAAARSVEPTNLEQLVLAALRGFPQGATSFELAAAMSLSLVTVSPRLRPLANKGRVIACGQRPGESGRMQTVWKLAPATMPLRFDERGQGSFL